MIPSSFKRAMTMIDGIKAMLLGVEPESLKRRLDFFTPVNLNTGEAEPYSYSRLGNLRLSLTQKNTCLIRGSLHKYAHAGLNSTDFGYSDLTGCVNALADFFETKPEQFVLQNVEFGVNLDFPPAEIIENLLLYGSNPFAPMSANVRHSQGLKCQLARYSLKLYGKNQTRLRLETQVKKMQFIQRITGGKALTFESFKDKEILERFGEMLVATWNKVLLWEEIATEGLKPNAQELLTLGRYPNYWTGLQKTNPENFKKRRKRFLRLQEQRKTTTRKEDVARLAGETWAALLQT